MQMSLNIMRITSEENSLDFSPELNVTTDAVGCVLLFSTLWCIYPIFSPCLVLHYNKGPAHSFAEMKTLKLFKLHSRNRCKVRSRSSLHLQLVAGRRQVLGSVTSLQLLARPEPR